MTHRIITAPVIIPDKPDCDYNRGEPPLTKQQIKKLKKKTFDEYQLIDYDHNKKNPVYTQTYYEKEKPNQYGGNN